MIRVEQTWRELLALLEDGPPWQTVFVLGPTDSGKTTLCRFLGQHLSRKWTVARVDCDPGQSVLGPPATLGAGWEPYHGSSLVAWRFVGSTSPSRHFLQTLTGIKRLYGLALEEGAQRIVFDSSGYMDTGAGREFHFQTLDLLEPDHLVALQRGNEMELLLANFARRARPRVHRLPVSGAIISRNPIQRQAYRRQKFNQYFRNASLQKLPLEGMGFHGMVPSREAPGSCRHLLIALCDRRGFVAALGIIEELDWSEGCMRLYAPPFESGQIASVQFGSIRLDQTGEEL
jgi:polynucleotide 5'-hydroxyl-kinase GRC3/NOL9